MATPDTLARLTEALNGATSGTWDYTIDAMGDWSVYGNCQQDSMADADLVAHSIKQLDDAYFMVLAKNAMPALLAAVAELEKLSLTLEAGSKAGRAASKALCDLDDAVEQQLYFTVEQEDN